MLDWKKCEGSDADPAVRCIFIFDARSALPGSVVRLAERVLASAANATFGSSNRSIADIDKDRFTFTNKGGGQGSTDSAQPQQERNAAQHMASDCTHWIHMPG